MIVEQIVQSQTSYHIDQVERIQPAANGMVGSSSLNLTNQIGHLRGGTRRRCCISTGNLRSQFRCRHGAGNLVVGHCYGSVLSWSFGLETFIVPRILLNILDCDALLWGFRQYLTKQHFHLLGETDQTIRPKQRQNSLSKSLGRNASKE